MKKQDVELATTEEIFEELAKRFPGFLVVLYDEPTAETHGTRVIWNGSLPLALGLVEVAKQRILEDLKQGKVVE